MDENECDWENGGCEHDCINTDGSFHCTCRENFQLDTDNKGCKGTNKLFRVFLKKFFNNYHFLAIGKVCKKIQSPQFGEVKCPDYTSRTFEYPPGAECYLKCHKGYKLDGDSKKLCESNGEWSGPNAECIRK